jgi:hypothetical protein
MSISFTQVLIWIIIAAGVGVVGELIAHRRAPDGIVGAIIVGLLAIFLTWRSRSNHRRGYDEFSSSPARADGAWDRSYLHCAGKSASTRLVPRQPG